MIDQGVVINMLSGAITTVILAAAPLLITAMVVGLIISIFQATTQINEQTIVFVAKIFSVMISLIIFGPWMLTTLHEFTIRLYGYVDLLFR